MHQDIKSQTLNEIESRITRLKEHEDDKIILTGNQYDELNQSLSKVIGVALLGELEGLKSFIEKLH